VADGRTILIIDDNVNLALGFAQVLKGAGYAAHTAHTAEDGLSLARSLRPDAIILDVRMPFVNGMGFLYRLRALPAHNQTPVLVVTGATVDDEMGAELADLRAVVKFKPLGMDDLLTTIETLLENQVRSNQSGDVYNVN
jgi:two-component system, OmpR family, response regulator